MTCKRGYLLGFLRPCSSLSILGPPFSSSPFPNAPRPRSPRSLLTVLDSRRFVFELSWIGPAVDAAEAFWSLRPCDFDLRFAWPESSQSPLRVIGLRAAARPALEASRRLGPFDPLLRALRAAIVCLASFARLPGGSPRTAPSCWGECWWSSSRISRPSCTASPAAAGARPSCDAKAHRGLGAW